VILFPDICWQIAQVRGEYLKDMTQNNLFFLKVISVLLQYPDDAFLDWLTFLEKELKDKVSDTEKEKLLGFAAYIQTMPLLSLQEHYTRIFDMNPRTCLNLTYHSLGDSEERGRTLAQLDQVYFQAGYERTTKELPDYLPLMLEFLAQCPDPEGIDLLWSQMGGVKNIAQGFDDPDSPYRLLFEILTDLVESETG
jgi:nitrate reductase molybdenum cofactor assembly chaperone NarJ/NarW